MTGFHLKLPSYHALAKSRANTSPAPDARAQTNKQAEVKLHADKHSPAQFTHMDVRKGLDKEKSDILLGRVQWSLENQLNNPEFRGKHKKIQKSINDIQAARNHLNTLPKDKPLSTQDIALVAHALDKTAKALPESSQQKTVSMLATFMNEQWGNAKRAGIAENAAIEQHYLKNDGAHVGSGKEFGLTAEGGVGASGLASASAGGAVGIHSSSSDRIDHQGAHVHENNTRLKLGVHVNGGATKLVGGKIGGEISAGKNAKGSEVYAGGTKEYYQQHGYKTRYGNIKMDAKLAARPHLKPGEGKITLPDGQSQIENLANAKFQGAQRLNPGQQRMMGLVGFKNQLRAQEKTQQQVQNQQSLLQASLASEFGLDLTFAAVEKKQTHTLVSGGSKEMSVSAKAHAGVSASVVNNSTLSAQAGASAKLIKTDKAYVKHSPVWSELRKEQSAQKAGAEQRIQHQRKAVINQLAEGFTANHPNLLPKGKTIATASEAELMKALTTLEHDFDQYASQKKILEREGSSSMLASAMKKNTKKIAIDYGAAHGGLGSMDKNTNTNFVKAATVVHAAIGSRLLEMNKNNPEKASQALNEIDRVATKIQNPSFSYDESKTLPTTHFSSSNDFKSTQQVFEFSAGAVASSGLLQKNLGAAVKIEKTDQTQHPDRHSRGESLTITINMPSNPSATTLEQIAADVASKAGDGKLYDSILPQLTDMVDIGQESAGSKSIQFKFSKLPKTQDNATPKYEMEYATARLALRQGTKNMSLGSVGMPARIALSQKKTRHEEIIPVATSYGPGSLRNMIRAYNASQMAASNGQDNNWPQQKQLREGAFETIFTALGDNQSPQKALIAGEFEHLKSGSSTEQKAAIESQKNDFFAAMQAVNAEAKNGNISPETRQKADQAMEGFLHMQHPGWVKETVETSMQANAYEPHKH